MTQTRHLSPDEIAFHREKGYVQVRGLLSPDEAAFHRPELHALADRRASG
jgi:hypothetical protein